MTCGEAIGAYALRSIGMGLRALPKGDDITLCEQVVLIGSGLIWNLYFALLALAFGFFIATGLALMKASDNAWVRRPAAGFVFIMRGSPLFIQFFFAYAVLVALPKIEGSLALGAFELEWTTRWFTKAWLGALIVLVLNTSAYSAEIFYGALRAVPHGDVEAAKAYGLSPVARFRRIIWPTLLRLAWPAYTNEAIFLFHATTLVFFSSFPTWRQSGDALYYANYFSEKTYNPFLSYPIAAGWFVFMTLVLIMVFGTANAYLNRHMAPGTRQKLRYRPQMIR